MKRKRIPLLLAALISLTLAACGAKPPPALTVESEATLRAVFMLPASRIPETGWDEDSLGYTIYLGGYQRPFPLTLERCGSLFSVAQDDAFRFETDGTATGHLLYQGCYVGTVTLTGCASESRINEGSVRSMTFTAPKANDGNYYPSIYPVSVNHVTIGSTAEEVTDYLGFSGASAGGIDVTETVGRYRITLKGTAADGVTELTLTDTQT